MEELFCIFFLLVLSFYPCTLPPHPTDEQMASESTEQRQLGSSVYHIFYNPTNREEIRPKDDTLF